MPYRSIQDPAKLRRILQAMLLLQGDSELPDLLRDLIEEARSMTGARYGALGVLNLERNALAEFVTVGLDAEAEERIGSPTGKRSAGTAHQRPQAPTDSRDWLPPRELGLPGRAPADVLIPGRTDQGA